MHAGAGSRDGGSRRADCGQVTLELALCLPLVAVALAAVVETGLLASDQVRLWHAARSAVRAAVVDADPAAAMKAAEASGLEALSLSIQPDERGRSLGEPLTVSLSYELPARSPLVGDLFSRIELHADATMRVEVP